MMKKLILSILLITIMIPTLGISVYQVCLDTGKMETLSVINFYEQPLEEEQEHEKESKQGKDFFYNYLTPLMLKVIKDERLLHSSIDASLPDNYLEKVTPPPKIS